MAERGRVRAQGRTRTWDVARPRGFAWPSGAALGGAGDVLRRWLVRDVAAGRLLPWIPIAFGFGIVVYFTAEHEPLWWATLAAAGACAVAAFCARARPFAFPILVALTAAAGGFSTATLKTARI